MFGSRREETGGFNFVGYEFQIDDATKTRILSLLRRDLVVRLDELQSEAVVAVHYEKAGMSEWYTRRTHAYLKSVEEKAPLPCVVQGIYANTKRGKKGTLALNALVLHVTVDGSHQWVTLKCPAGMRPIGLKAAVGAGKLGKEIPVNDRITLSWRPYIR